MLYIIDGYNLMFRSLSSEDGDLQSQRTSIIAELNQKCAYLNLEVTVVFDAHYQYGEGSRSQFNSLEIIFTDETQSADDCIVHLVKASSTPKNITVVTSDKKLAWRVRTHLGKTQTIKAFLSWLNTRYLNKKRRKPTKKPSKPLEMKSTEQVPAQPNKSASENFEYYLYHFEKRFKEMTSEKKKRKDKKESEMERWKRLFEEKDGGES